MAGIIKISEAATIAIHTVYLLVKNSEKLLSNKQLAEMMKVSENHLSKVTQRLTKLGLIASVRGAKGGFKINKPASSINLLEIYEAFDGKINLDSCLLDEPICAGKQCMFGGILNDVNQKFIEYMKNTTFKDY